MAVKRGSLASRMRLSFSSTVLAMLTPLGWVLVVSTTSIGRESVMLPVFSWRETVTGEVCLCGRKKLARYDNP